MKNRILFVTLTVAAFTAGCIGIERESSTGPSASGTSAFMGSWSSSNLIPSPESCTDFKWNVTEQTSTSAKGSFSASCAGDLKVSGVAQGYLTSASSLNWSAEGNASAPGLTSCAIKLTGTAELTVDSIKIPYSGDTCLGKVSGTEHLKKR
jgi:hypothetical protein